MLRVARVFLNIGGTLTQKASKINASVDKGEWH